MVKLRGSKIATGLNYVLEQGYFVDTVYEAGLVPGVALVARGVDAVETGFFDRLTAGIGKLTQWIASKVKQAHAGSLRLYIASYIVGIAIIISAIILTIIFG